MGASRWAEKVDFAALWWERNGWGGKARRGGPWGMGRRLLARVEVMRVITHELSIASGLS